MNLSIFLGSEHQVWGFSDEARAELPLDADDNEAEPSVVGSVWNFNSQAQVTVGEKTTKAPNLISSTGSNGDWTENPISGSENLKTRSRKLSNTGMKNFML